MAAETLTDVTKGLQEVNETLRQQAVAEGKADPLKFIKEEAVNLLIAESNRRASKELVKVEKKEAKDLLKTDKAAAKARKAIASDLVEHSKTRDTYLQNMAGGFDQLQLGQQRVINANRSYFEKIADNFKAVGEHLVGMYKEGLTDRRFQGAAAAEDKKKKKFNETRTYKVLQGIGKGILSMSMSLGGLLKDKVKAGVSSIFGLLQNLALGGLALAAIAFLNNPKFAEMMKFIRDEVIPVIGKFYEDILVPLFQNLKTYFFDVIESFGKFFDDPDFQKTIKSFKEGKFLDGFGSLFTSLLKPGGLIDNLSTNLWNLFARIFGMEQIEGKDTVFGMIGKQFIKFYARFQNYFRSTVNDVFKTLKMDNRLDLIDEDTGKNIESEYNKKIRLEKEAEQAKREELIKATPELTEKRDALVKERARIEAMPKRMGDGFTALVNMERIKAERKLLDDEAELQKIAENKIRDEQIKKEVKNKLGRGALFSSIEKRIENQEKFLVIARKKENAENIARITKRLEDMKKYKAAIVSNSGNTQVITSDSSQKFSISSHPIHIQSPTIATLTNIP